MSKESFEIEITTQSLKRWYYTIRTYIYSKLVEKGIVCKSCGRLVDIFGIGMNIECDVCYYQRLDKDVLKQVVQEPAHLNLSLLSQLCTECDSIFYGLPSGPTVCKPCVMKKAEKEYKRVIKLTKQYPGLTMELITTQCKQCGEDYFRLPTSHSICNNCIKNETVRQAVKDDNSPAALTVCNYSYNLVKGPRPTVDDIPPDISPIKLTNC